MPDFRFHHPIEIRYGDLDPQGHLNNAKYLTYFEQARIHYLIKLGLFNKGQSFMDVGMIVADIHITFQTPACYADPIKIGVRTSKIGNKSMVLERCVMNADTGEMFAEGTVILVTFDYREHKTISVPDEWREKITSFEGLNA